MGPTGKGGGSGAHKIEMERLRREDHLRVKHDKLFSDWKILIGSADWNDHIAGEEGSHRYRLHNLPSSYFGPGVYELGLIQHATTEESKHGKLRRHAVVVVYLGQADNVRQRLQRYGQTGSHLEGSRAGVCSVTDKNVKVEKLDENVKKLASEAIPQVIDTGTKLRGWLFQPELSGSRETSTNCNIQGGLRLFTEVFSRGYSIAFRWAKTESKQMAEKVEAELLHIFDYPRNTALNGARRPRDILAKLDLLQLELERSLCLGRALGIGSRKWAILAGRLAFPCPLKNPPSHLQLRLKFPQASSSPPPDVEAELEKENAVLTTELLSVERSLRTGQLAALLQSKDGSSAPHTKGSAQKFRPDDPPLSLSKHTTTAMVRERAAATRAPRA